MAPKPLARHLAVEPYKGGESKIPGVAKPIKLASNENPLGASPAASEAYAEAAARLHLYPDPGAVGLRSAIAARYGLDVDRIVCGAGSDEIFQMLAKAYLEPGDEIVQSQYAFSVYAIFCRQAGAEVRSGRDVDYVADVDSMLAQVNDRTKIVFLANPNNPTGTYLPIAEVRRLHAGLPANVLLVLDAAYAEYVRRNDYAAGIELAAEHDNVLMTRTFSKIHGLAALRVGWAYGARAVIDALNRVRGPFNVPGPAQAAAAAAIADGAFAEESAVHNARELEIATSRLRGLGLTVVDSVCNFVLIHFPAEKPASAADAFLRAKGFILRPMGGYGLPGSLRLSIGSSEENAGVLGAIAEFMGR